MLQEREILASATLEDSDEGREPLRRYRFYSAMLVRASGAVTRRILTDYQLYAKMIPYVDKADYSPSSRILQLAGGVLGFKLSSSLRFEELSESWIRYRVVAGHFTGLSGDIVFEPQGERGTAVIMRGELLGSAWPPKFVLERGAEIVFGFTARRMRSYIESQKIDTERHGSPPGSPNGNNGDREVPQPRSHL